MKNPISLTVMLTSLALGLGSTSLAGHSYGKNTFTDTARVISAKPVYQTIIVSTPRRECWTERVHHGHEGQGHRRDSYTAPLAGAILGGVVGNQFGGGNGKTALTIGGALLGASIGNDHTNTRRSPRRGSGLHEERHCETIEHERTREELTGYRVKYRYKGETFRTRMDHHPGDTLRVRVKVSPVH